MRSRQVLPLVLLGFFATALMLAVALVQKAKNEANQDFLAEQAEFAERRNEIYDAYLFVDTKDRDEKFAKRMKNSEARYEQAVERRDEAFAAAYTRQSYIIWAGVILFAVFVVVTLYMARKSADVPQG
jgi:CRISPR/Cas system CMR subunit Cmr6 (Cas7 group RAMP superfamily)